MAQEIFLTFYYGTEKIDKMENNNLRNYGPSCDCSDSTFDQITLTRVLKWLAKDYIVSVKIVHVEKHWISASLYSEDEVL